MTTLALKYRPKAFSDLVGQTLTARVLQKMVEKKNVPHGLLFSGPSGTGKTSAARILANELNASENELAVLELDAASNGGVDEVRSLIERLRFSVGSEYRVVILDEAHSMTRPAFNALLKTLEEPPPGVIFVLVTTEPSRIPETVLTRLMEFEFHRISPEAIYERLSSVTEAESIESEPELLDTIARTADGSLRSALNKLEQAYLAGVSTSADYARLAGTRDMSPALVNLLIQGDTAKVFEALDKILYKAGNPLQVANSLVTCFKDLLILRSGGELPPGKLTDARKELAFRLDAERITACLQLIWDLKIKTRATENSRENVEILLVLLGRILHIPGSTPEPVFVNESVSPVVESERRISLSDIA